jgi:hypothetical protein
VAETLAATPPAGRQAVWERFLDGRADRDDVVRALADVDPDGPAPEGAEDGPPLRIREMPAVEAFPVEVLPEPVAAFIEAVAAAIGCPADFVGLAALVVAGGAIGRSASLRLKPDYFPSASLYGINVGGPASGKSPALAKACRPLWGINQRLHDRYRIQFDEFKAAMEAYENAKKGERPPKPPAPALESLALDNTTVEAMAGHLMLNPRGLTVIHDEASAWVASFNCYRQGGRGADRQFYLKALYGQSIRIDRKGHLHDPIVIPHPSLAVVGNIPPDLLGEFRDPKGRADGFLERILFAFPDPAPRPKWTEAGVSAEATDGWAEVIERLYARPMAARDGRAFPNVVGMGPRAKAEWIAFHDAHADEANGAGYDLAELAGDVKLLDFTARLGLVLHLLDLATDPTLGPGDPIPDLSARAVEGSIRLWGYFRSHARRVRWHLHASRPEGPTDPAGERVLSALRSRPGGLTQTELSRGVFGGNKTAEEIDAILRPLAERGDAYDTPEPTGGRPAQRWFAGGRPTK